MDGDRANNADSILKGFRPDNANGDSNFIGNEQAKAIRTTGVSLNFNGRRDSQHAKRYPLCRITNTEARDERKKERLGRVRLRKRRKLVLANFSQCVQKVDHLTNKIDDY